MSTGEDSRVWHDLEGAKAWAMPELDAAPRSKPQQAKDTAPPTAAELSALQQRAFAEAHAEGYAAGLAAGEQATQAAVERLQTIAAGLAKPLDELDRDLEYSLSNLALILARRIVGRAVREDPESLHSLVTQAVDILGRDIESRVDIYLHPEDLQLLNEHMAIDPNWKLHPDEELQAGDVRVKRGLAEVDGRLQQRLDRLAAEMLNG